MRLICSYLYDVSMMLCYHHNLNQITRRVVVALDSKLINYEIAIITTRTYFKYFNLLAAFFPIEEKNEREREREIEIKTI